MPKAANLIAIDKYWSGMLGCSVDELNNKQPSIVVKVWSEERVLLFLKEQLCCLAMPQSLLDQLATKLELNNPDEIFNISSINQIFNNYIDKIIGPAYVGYADETDLIAQRQDNKIKLINDETKSALINFSKSVNELDWEHSGIEIDQPPIFGYFEGEEILSAASYEIWGDSIAHIGLVTLPTKRGNGLGKLIVSATADYAINQGLIAQYRTLESNLPSIAIANRLGFQAYAKTIAVRIKGRDHSI
jgi:RimJ/RimL family protein N-acetyltransferase